MLEKRGLVNGHRWVLKQGIAKTMRREMTPEESLLWKRLRSNQCGGLHFRRQQVIDGFIADFYCHAVGLIVEVDGSIHEQQADYDLSRDRILSGRGLRVIRFSNDRVHEDLENVLAEIQAFATAATQVNDLPENEI
jgi:very-short-patch-repair endonuclease